MKFSTVRTVASVALALAALNLRAEAPYDFQKRLLNPHLADRRDATLAAAADEFAFADGATIAVAADADRRVKRAADDFADYLKVSMNVGAKVERWSGGEVERWRGGVVVALDAALGAKTSRIAVTDAGVRISAGDARAAMQALFHLEDLMNLRAAPFLKKGVENRRERYGARMVHSGYAVDHFPDGYLATVAHGGFDSILFYVDRPDVTRHGKTDIAALIDAAEAWGLDAWLYSSLQAKTHPDDPGAAEEYDRTYGEIGRRYPKAKGIILVAESCWFHSKDPRVARPARPGKYSYERFPCCDHPQWLSALKKAYQGGNPDGEFVYWTYNFCWYDQKLRTDFIRTLPEGITLNVTFVVNGEDAYHLTKNGASFTIEDYTICEPGPSPLFRGEAAAAKARGMKLMTQACTCGRTWDFGGCPYTPAPFLWKQRFDALNEAQKTYGLSRLMESHHMGYVPNMIAELAKEAFTEGGLPFERHIRAIAARDFGEKHADEVVAIWNEVSDAFRNYVATGENQYGPFRFGPACPLNALAKPLKFGEMPGFHGFICNPNFGWDTAGGNGQKPYSRLVMDKRRMGFEVPLFLEAGARFVAAAQKLRGFANELTGVRRDAARREAGVVEYVGRSFLTCGNIKAAYLAEENRDVAEVLRIARREYENTAAALPLLEEDSRLGFEPSMRYSCGPETVRWKLVYMKDLYHLGDAGATVPLFDTPRPSSFDPKAAGWTRVFHDDFDGKAIDTNKWYRPHFARKGAPVATDGKGHLVFTMKKGADGKLPNGYLYSVPEYEYGYYEARVRFTTALGWWAASWMYGGSNQNPFLDGFEIDTFEDFYTRLKDDHPLKDRMAHSMHAKYGGACSSEQCVSEVHKTKDDFHLIACKWDPLSISFYLDGQLVGGYNAFENATATRPLHAILSVERSRGGLGGHAKPGVEEGEYLVDHVSIWKDFKGEALAPKVRWTSEMGNVFAPTGTVLDLAVDVAAADPSDPVTAVYLFDNGYFIKVDDETPFNFRVPLSEEFLKTTSYGRFKRQAGREVSYADGYPHVFVAFARTKSGRVGHTEPFARILRETPAPAAYEGKPAAIPGTVESWRYDVGGQDRAYHKVIFGKNSLRCQNPKLSPRPEDPVDLTKGKLGPTFAGEWYDYTVDVAAAGDYRATLRYASAMRSRNAMWLLCDGRLVGEFPVPAGDYYDTNPTRKAVADVKLPAGRHVLTLFCKAQITFAGLDFEK